MTGRTLIKLCFAAMGMGLASPVLAADYDGQLPGEGFNGMWSCLYARIDGGGSFYADNPTAVVTMPSGDEPSLDSYSPQIALGNTGFFEGGVGCQVSDSMRVEVTGGLNLKSSFAHGTIDDLPYVNGDFSARYVFVSGYWDITNYAGFTPYVGGGIGASYNESSGSILYGDMENQSEATFSGGNYDFAYHITFGMSYDINQSMKFDLAYRYVDFGSATGQVTTASQVGSFDVGTIDAHEVKVGLRYQFSQPTW
jgi:opacity protein-like surface antigen